MAGGKSGQAEFPERSSPRGPAGERGEAKPSLDLSRHPLCRFVQRPVVQMGV